MEMKKKFFQSLSVVLAFMLALGNASTAFAETEREIETSTDTISNAEVNLLIESTFTVSIPKKVILNGETKEASYKVLVKGDIAGNEAILVKPNEKTMLQQTGKEDIEATITQNKTEWVYSELEVDEFTETDGLISAPEATAGEWTGSLQFVIGLDTGAVELPEAGLYDYTDSTWTLKRTWESMVADGTLVVTDGVVTTPVDATGNYTQTNYSAEELNGILVISEDVTEIGASGFALCVNLTGIVLHDGITTIAPNAFRMCTGLDTIDLPDSITSIPSCAFFGCTGLTSIVIPNSVETIDELAFNECTSLTNIDIPNSVTSIDRNVFSGCTSLTNIDIPSSVTSMGSSVFSGCTSLASISIPDGVQVIESGSFRSCTSLNSVHIPNSVEEIKQNAFRDCDTLESIVVPDGVETIGKYAFKDCDNLNSVTLPNSITDINTDAFSGCTSLTSINIPNNLDTISDYMLYGCTSLASIEIPVSVTEIGLCAFWGCSNLTSVTYDGTTYDTLTELTTALDNAGVTIGNNAFKNTGLQQ